MPESDELRARRDVLDAAVAALDANRLGVATEIAFQLRSELGRDSAYNALMHVWSARRGLAASEAAGYPEAIIDLSDQCVRSAERWFLEVPASRFNRHADEALAVANGPAAVLSLVQVTG